MKKRNEDRKKEIKHSLDKAKNSMRKKKILEEKIIRIKKLIERGEYKIPPEEVAKKMLEFFKRKH